MTYLEVSLDGVCDCPGSLHEHCLIGWRVRGPVLPGQSQAGLGHLMGTLQHLVHGNPGPMIRRLINDVCNAQVQIYIDITPERD